MTNQGPTPTSSQQDDENNNDAVDGTEALTSVRVANEVSTIPSQDNHGSPNGSFQGDMTISEQSDAGFMPQDMRCSICSLCDKCHNQRQMRDDILQASGRVVPRRTCTREIDHASSGTYVVNDSLSLSWEHAMPAAEPSSLVDEMTSAVASIFGDGPLAVDE